MTDMSEGAPGNVFSVFQGSLICDCKYRFGLSFDFLIFTFVFKKCVILSGQVL